MTNKIRLHPGGKESGYVYCIGNDSYPDWIKIGQTGNLTSRLGQYNAYSPEDNFYVVASEKINNYKRMESILLRAFSQYPSSSFKASNSEWFNIDKETAEKTFIKTIESSFSFSWFNSGGRSKKPQKQKKKLAKKKEPIDPLLDAAINRIEKNRRVQQNIISLQKSRRETKPLLKLLYNLEFLNKHNTNQWMEEQEEEGRVYASDYVVDTWKNKYASGDKLYGQIPPFMRNRYGANSVNR